MPTYPGYKIWENTAPLTVGTTQSAWYDTTGYTTLIVSAAIANSTGTTSFTVQGSYDGATQDTTLPYSTAITASTPAGAPPSYVVQHTFVRFQVVQATATATTSTFYVQSKA